ncbi:MAG: hypothetical protein U0Q18_27725 [Bryobacteraceae bacterium]
MNRASQDAEVDILRYLVSHPDARDTVEGIAEWWLPPLSTHSIADIRGALERLEARNLILVWKSAAASAIYGFNRESAAAAKAYLHGFQTGGAETA